MLRVVHHIAGRYIRQNRCFSSEVFSGGLTALDRQIRTRPALKERSHKTWYGDTSHDDEGDDYDDEYMAELERELELEQEYLDEADPMVRVGRKLLALGKVPYKYAEPLPLWIRTRKDEVTIHRTSHQLRKALQDWMIKPDRELNTKYRTKRLYWRETDKPGSDGRAPTQNIYAYGPNEAVAYTHYFFPGKFSMTRRVFREMQSLLPGFNPQKMLDFGCGPGTGGVAALDVWGTHDLPQKSTYEAREQSGARKNHKKSEGNGNIHYSDEEEIPVVPSSTMQYTGVDPSRAMLDACSVLMADPTRPAPNLWDRIGDVVKRCHKTGERFDLINASFVLTELASDPMRRAAVMLLFELLAPGGCLVIVETGSPVGSHTVRTARQLLLDKFGRHQLEQEEAVHDEKTSISNRKKKLINKEQNAHRLLDAPSGMKHSDLWASVVSPCTHDKECPLRPGAWCSFSQRVHSPIVRKAGEEKFSYVVIQRAMKSTTANTNSAESIGSALDWVVDSEISGDPAVMERRNSNPTPLQVLRDAARTPKGKEPEVLQSVDWDSYEPMLRREEWSRVLRSPLKKKGHVVMDLCGPDGNLQRATTTRKTIPRVPALYAGLRKTHWGGLYPALQHGEGVSNRHSNFALSTAEKEALAEKEAIKAAKTARKHKNTNDLSTNDEVMEEDDDHEDTIETAGDDWNPPDLPEYNPERLGRRSIRARRGATLRKVRQRQLDDQSKGI
jgi:ribosomal protein RSM22 (predicted rRNA methylase)